MFKQLNPESLSPLDSKQLEAFFEDESLWGVHMWSKDETYIFSNGTRFQLAHDVIERKRKNANTGVRYEFISEKLVGKGCLSRVFEIAGTLKFESGQSHFKPAGYNNKTRVIKIQNHTKEYPIKRAQAEYDIAKRIPYLAIKEPTFYIQTSYSVMRKLKGEELLDILIDERKGLMYLSLKNRIDLSKALLRALKEHIFDKGSSTEI